MHYPVVLAVRQGESALAFTEVYANLGQIARDLVRAVELRPRPDRVLIYLPDGPVDVEAILRTGGPKGDARVVRVPGLRPERTPAKPFQHELRVRISYGGSP